MNRTGRYGLTFLITLCCAFLLKASIPQVATGTWQPGISMAEVRSGAASVLLQDGRVLIIGGSGANGALASAELMTPDGSFSAAPAMNSGRSGHAAVLLQDGRVLVTGGTSSGGGVTNSAEIFDPVANSWTLLSAPMLDARSGHTASALSDGRVLLAGGQNSTGALSSLEIFEPLNDSFASTGVMSSPRMNHSAAVMQDGRVLLAGGSDGTNPLASSDLYDPAAGSVSAGPIMSTPRSGASATTSLHGEVIVIGGNNGSADLASAEIFDPATNLFSLSAASLATPRGGHKAFLLPNNGSVLIVGGSSAGNDLASAELYYQWADSFHSTGAMSVARPGLTGSALSQGGLFLAAGGTNLSNSELYGFATVKTDAGDYPPGAIVTITGQGWQPGETVTLFIHEVPNINGDQTFTTTADASGNIYNNQYSPEPTDVGFRYFLTATGSQSQAQTTFTDRANTTTTIVSHTPNPSAFGQTVTFGVTVTGTGTVSEGCVQIFDGASAVSSKVPVSSGSASVPANSLSAGPHTNNITAVYTDTGSGCPAPGNGNNFSGSTSAAVSHTVNPADTATTISSHTPNPSVVGQGVLVSFGVAVNSPGSGTPTGSVTVTDGTATCTGTVAAGNCTLTPTSAGVKTLTATYGGDSNFNASPASAGVSHTVNAANTTTTITSDNPDPSVVGQAVTVKFSVSVNAPAGGSIPGADNVSVSDGVDSCTGTVTSGQCLITLSTAGTRTLKATYQGSSNYNASPVSSGESHLVKTPASLNYTASVAYDSSTASGDTIVRATQSIIVKLTVQNSGESDASGVHPPTLTVNHPLGAAAATCAAGNPDPIPTIPGGGNRDFTYSCGPVSGDGILSFTTNGQASGTDAISGNSVSTSGSITSNSVTVDSTAPTMGLSPVSGTYNTPFSFSWSITDPVAGGVSSLLNASTCNVTVSDGVSTVFSSTACSGNHALSNAGTYTVNASASDNGGNNGSDSRNYTVIADSTPPVITPTVTGTLGNHGWYTSNVHVTWSVTDPESAITNQSGCGASDVTVDTAGVTFTCSATSSGGTDSNSVTIKRDASAPSITASPSPAANANGWNKTDVTVSYNCTDNGPSGVDNAASDLANDVLSASGTASGTCVDNAGNSASASYTAKIDKLAPNAPTAHRTPDANLAGWNNSNVTVSFTDSGDNGDSGIDSCTSSSTLMIETSGTDVSGTCTDKAGNVSPQATVTVKIDKTKPVVTGSRNVPANANGWNNTPVAVSFSCADAGAVQSGIATDTVTGQTVNSEVADLTVTNTGSCVDVAGNTADSASVEHIKIDMTPPNAPTAHPSPGPNGFGWNNAPVTVSFTDNGDAGAVESGVAGCSDPNTVSTETSGTIVSGTCTDKAGNASAAATVTVKIDMTKPVISGSRTPPPNSYGWNNTDVTVSFTCADTGAVQSDIASATVAGATLSGEGAGQSVTNSGICTDKAGNPADSATVSGIDIDKTPPTISVALDRPTAGTGWFNIATGRPTGKFTCSDSLSGLPPGACPADQGSLPDGANQTVSGSVMDKAGNSASASITHINVDLTPPSITTNAPINNSTYPNYVLNAAAPSSYNCSDATSGVASCAGPVANGGNFDTSITDYNLVTPGINKSFTVNATDVAGNPATLTNNYNVFYLASGSCLGSPGHAILEPIDFTGASVFPKKQGSTVPAKFRVCDANGNSIGTPGVVSSFVLLGWGAGTITTVNEDPVVATNSDTAFRWDSSGQQWIFNISTKNLTAGYTYFYLITLNDGSTIAFNFGLK